MPSLRIIGNLVAGGDENTDKVTEAGILPRIFSLFAHKRPTVKREICWILSNFTAGTSAQIGEVFKTEENFKMIAELALTGDVNVALTIVVYQFVIV